MADETKTQSAETQPTDTQDTTTNKDESVTETQPTAEDTQPTGTETADTTESPEKSESLLSGDDKEEKPEESDDPVPEEYQFEAPEGTDLDEGMVESFKPLAKELGLGQKAAQKLVDMVAKKTQEATEHQQQQEAKMIAEWQKEITSDPSHKELLSNAKLTVSKFGADNPEFEKLTKSWLGSHPGFVKFLASIGTHLKEADMDSGSAAAKSGDQSLGSILYPNMGKKK